MSRLPALATRLQPAPSGVWRGSILRVCRFLPWLLGIIVLPPSPGAQTPSFQGLGQMQGATGGTYVNGVSGDGSTVVGYAWVSGTATRAFRWTAAVGFEDLGNLGGDDSSNNRAYGASFDGSVVVGQSARADRTLRGFRWTAGGGMQELPFYEALATSANGSVVVGMNYRWTAPGQIDDLGYLGGNNATYASGVSGVGDAVVGYSETSPNRYQHAFRWTPSGGLQDLGVTNGTESLAWGTSANGAVVFGEARDANQFWRAFRWTSALGMRDMGTLGGPMSTSHGASVTGAVIVGKSLINSQSSSLRAFRWTSATGMRDLKQELLNAGVTAVQNWTLAVAADVSDDGNVIVGWGYPAALTPAEPFRAVLPSGITDVDAPIRLQEGALRIIPNPMSGAGGRIAFRIPDRLRGSGQRDVGLDVVAVDGRRIRTLEVGSYDASGVGDASWDARDESGHAVASGAYFLRLLLAGRAVESTRFVMVR